MVGHGVEKVLQVSPVGNHTLEWGTRVCRVPLRSRGHQRFPAHDTRLEYNISDTLTLAINPIILLGSPCTRQSTIWLLWTVYKKKKKK